jgi:hypothetical protein
VSDHSTIAASPERMTLAVTMSMLANAGLTLIVESDQHTAATAASATPRQ